MPIRQPIVFDEVIYPSQRALARHIAVLVERDAKAVQMMLYRRGNDGAAVIDYCRDEGQRWRRRPITYNGVTYSTRAALIRHLAPHLGLCASQISQLLRRHHDDVDAMLRSHRRGNKPITYDGVAYPTHRALARVLAPRLGIGIERVRQLLHQHDDDVDAVLASRPQ